MLGIWNRITLVYIDDGQGFDCHVPVLRRWPWQSVTACMQIPGKFLGILITMLEFFGQGLGHDEIQHFRHIGAKRAGWWWHAVQGLIHDGIDVFARKRRLPGEHFIQHDTQ